MKVFYPGINNKFYYLLMFGIISIMLMGLLVNNPYMGSFGGKYILHCTLVVMLSSCFLLYPKYKNFFFRMIIMMLASAYFYTLFLLYPDTWSTFIFICLLPAFAIFFFDTKLFYVSLIMNSVLLTITFTYISLTDHNHLYPQISDDLIGNIINFIGSQAIIYIVFLVSKSRLKTQQLYYEQAQESERLKTTSQLAAAVAHEIRNPLTVVKGFLQFYSENDHLDRDMKHHFSLMIEELDTAEHVILHFLSMAKPDSDKKVETVSVKTVLHSVTDLLTSYGLLRDNAIQLEVEDDCYIFGNSIELKQLFINLIKNALEASNKGDSVLVTAIKKENHIVEMKVIDYGLGMSTDEIRSLGTPFYSLKSTGTGLGLMICYHIVEKYKGSIQFSSSKEKGTTVTIRFPSKELSR